MNEIDDGEEYLVLKSKNKYSEIVASTDYKALIELNEKSQNLYKQVLEKYQSTGSISYSSDYMDNRSKLKDVIFKLTEDYPMLEVAFKRKNIPLMTSYSEVKMNLAYINKAFKIQNEVEDLGKNEGLSFEFVYDKNTENIYIDAQMGTENAMEVIYSIEKIINANIVTTGIGEINIRPIYGQTISIKPGKYNIVEVETVFPNGSAKHRSDAISKYRRANAKKITKSYQAEKNESINTSEIIDDELQSDASSGYLKVTSKGKNIINNSIKIIDIDI
ncbi:hypothetical protein [Weissella fangxianensis]|uniref:hypothetical protein n=1 Tax=Weissella fangxianensis TaxID=2953879 RepID=UPI0021573B61|nr:hypothetical protein [Weissella fangxianensis]